MALVGEAPGPEECDRGKPFVGPAGWVLDVGCKAAGVDKGMCWVTNVVKCMPPGAKRGTFRNPTRQEVEFCATRFLDEELARVQPNVVVALGGVALSWLVKEKRKITEWQGTVMEVPSGLARVSKSQARRLAVQQGER
jgi:DNA polymerase